MKILYFCKEAWEEAYVREKLTGFDIVFKPRGMADVGPEDADAEIICVFVNHPVTAPDMEKLPNLKLIATRSTGFDHIDLAAAKQKGIVVSSVPSYGVNTVAEFAFALILTLSRKVFDAHRRVVEQNSYSQEGLEGFDLSGKTIGVVGTGRIGAHVVKMAQGFDMKVIAFDERQNPDLVAQGIPYLSLQDLLAQSDIVTLHVPYLPSTHHLISRDTLKFFKKSAYLINTARGAVVDTVALVEALEQGMLAGAGLDVLEEEGLTFDAAKAAAADPNSDAMKVVAANKKLAQDPRVIITPHVAFDTREAVIRIIDTTVDNILKWQAGAPQNAVT